MALERLDGQTLADLVASGRRLDWREALRITGRVAEALHHAHTQGVVHRDVKPANIMVLRSGEPKITDVGIARVDAGHLTKAASSSGCRSTWPRSRPWAGRPTPALTSSRWARSPTRC